MTYDFEQVHSVLLATLRQADRVGYKGYSKFDGLLSPMTQALSFGWWPLRLVWTQLVMRSPINLRPLLQVKKGINPEAPALFARANLDCLTMDLPGPEAAKCETRARWCLDWLLAHDASEFEPSNSEGSKQGLYHGSCWGYHHPWQSPGFYQPPNYPNCYMTTIVADALLHGYSILGDDKYLNAARSSVDFILHDLHVFYENDEEKCLTYVPDMRTQLQVININALAGALLAQVGAITNETGLLEQARKLITFVVRNQTPYGAWYYTANPQQSLVTHDNYHTGMILDALLTYEQATGDTTYRQNYRFGLDYYRDHLFLPDGAPKWTNDRSWPYDVHGSGQGMLTFALADDLEMARQIADWGLAHFYLGDGNFAYQRNRFINKRFTLLHWGNGWMARGLGALLVAWQAHDIQYLHDSHGGE